jgi:hypothetical protein
VHAAHGLLTKLSTGDDDGGNGNGNGDNCWLVQSAWPGSHAPLPIRDPCAFLPYHASCGCAAQARPAPDSFTRHSLIHSFIHSFISLRFVLSTLLDILSIRR